MKKIALSILIFIFSLPVTKAQICVGTAGQVEWHAWNNLYDDEFSELSALPHYPLRPDKKETLFKLKAPVNYNNYFGSRIEGFIKVDTTSTVVFNVTGNRYVNFYLSTDDNPDNAILKASVPSSVGEEEHNTYPEQTTDSITLFAGQYYYFEIIHVEGGGGDHCSIWWKTDLVDTSQWNIITAAYIHSVSCLPQECLPPGTPCDDGDATTDNDIEDGHCNCFGEKTTTNNCIGTKGMITGYRYEGIPGSGLNDLYEATNFPGTPASSEGYEYFGKASTNVQVDVGYAIQAFLTVPVTGLYKFNVTGDDNTILFISSDESPENKQAHQMLVSSWSYMTQHDKFIYQSSSFITLEKGKFYYIEINNKDGGGSEHFSAFWQTPFTPTDTWKRIPALYFNDYDCEIACIPQGTICDDGDPFTNNDVYDANCMCVGTPCTGPDCDNPLANYVPYEKCSLTDQLDDNIDNNWVSCQETANPNSLRSAGHWIMYDLGERHELYQTQVWNYNVMGSTQNGMESVSIDYSSDGISWQEYGSYIWPLAPGDSGYGGFSGPNFNGLYARYILITSLDGPASCKGLGKIAFTAVVCPLEGTICDDKNDITFNDKYNNNCECLGSLIDENECVENTVILGDSTLYTSKYSAIDQVMSISDIAQDSRVSFVGGKSIELNVGFETYGQTLFLATIDTCTTQESTGDEKTRAEKLNEKAAQRDFYKMDVLTVTPIEEDEILISYYLEQPGIATLIISDLLGNKLYTLISHDFKNIGLYHKRFPLKKFANGNYNVTLNAPRTSIVKRMTVSH